MTETEQIHGNLHMHTRRPGCRQQRSKIDQYPQGGFYWKTAIQDSNLHAEQKGTRRRIKWKNIQELYQSYLLGAVISSARYQRRFAFSKNDIALRWKVQHRNQIPKTKIKAFTSLSPSNVDFLALVSYTLKLSSSSSPPLLVRTIFTHPRAIFLCACVSADSHLWHWCVRKKSSLFTSFSLSFWNIKSEKELVSIVWSIIIQPEEHLLISRNPNVLSAHWHTEVIAESSDGGKFVLEHEMGSTSKMIAVVSGATHSPRSDSRSDYKNDI